MQKFLQKFCEGNETFYFFALIIETVFRSRFFLLIVSIVCKLHSSFRKNLRWFFFVYFPFGFSSFIFLWSSFCETRHSSIVRRRPSRTLQKLCRSVPSTNSSTVFPFQPLWCSHPKTKIVCLVIFIFPIFA